MYMHLHLCVFVCVFVFAFLYLRTCICVIVRQMDHWSILEKLTGVSDAVKNQTLGNGRVFFGGGLETVSSELCIVESDKLWIGNSKL